MAIIPNLYRHPMPLLTDLYQLTMACAYWKTGRAEQEAVFHLFFRKNPFGGGYAIACGQEYVRDLLASFSFAEEDLDYMESLRGNDDKPLFEAAFLEELSKLKFSCDVAAVAEGTVVFPHEPLLRVRGPILQAQILETPLLNIMNFQTLVATKAARICRATGGEPVLEFGLRRAQGIDGALAASRAAYVGGCTATSNVLAGKLFGIPVRGTHAHSWVMSFDSEQEAFAAYAEAMPNNCVFLVDTYSTIEGVRRAIAVGHTLRKRGYRMAGIRLDSGDLAYLSIEARKLLDQEGFTDAVIVASNDLDEKVITSLKSQGSRIAVWGVGTKLSTAYDQPALGGVYKLAATRKAGEDWHYSVKLSEQAVKVSIPGLLQIRRFRGASGFECDMLYNEIMGAPKAPVLIDPLDHTRRKSVDPTTPYEDLLEPLAIAGKVVTSEVGLEKVRSRAQQQLAGFHDGIKRFVNPHQYPVGLEEQLHALRTELILAARKASR